MLSSNLNFGSFFILNFRTKLEYVTCVLLGPSSPTDLRPFYIVHTNSMNKNYKQTELFSNFRLTTIIPPIFSFLLQKHSVSTQTFASHLFTLSIRFQTHRSRFYLCDLVFYKIIC